MPYALPSTDPLGTDVRLDASGDLGVTISGDLDVVTQSDNVSQAIRIQMTTNPEDYLWGDDVGWDFSEYVDRPITGARVQMVKTDVMTILNRDPRIISVTDIAIDDTVQDQLVITPKALVDSIGVVQTPVVIEGGNG